MDDTDDWERLIRYLDEWTSASEIAPGRIRVSLPLERGSRQVIVVMTPDEWDDMTGVMWGDFDDAAEDVKRTLFALQPGEGFAVYSQYRLEPSVDDMLPEPPEFTPEPGGEWVTYDRDGRVVSRFADWVEPDERS